MQQQQPNYQADELSLYLDSVLNPDINIRKQAEAKIESICEQNFGLFLIE